MARPVWPVALPYMPHTHGIGEPYRGNLSSEMEGGNVRTRRTSTVVIGVVPLVLRFSVSEFLTFKAFVADTLGHGSAEFDMPVWNLTAAPVRRVRLRNDGKYKAQRAAGNAIDVSFELDVWDL